MSDYGHVDKQILNVLKEGRANPMLLREEIDELDSPQDVQRRVDHLRLEGQIRKVCHGLYALDEESSTRAGEDGE